MKTERPRVIILGAGFGGLFAARRLARANVDVLLIDRNNYHTFTPLLYQVATAALDPSEIAYPIRTIFRDESNVRFLLGRVDAIDHDACTVRVESGERTRIEPYDYLIVATGSVPTYFGNNDFADYTFELRTLQDSVRLRNHILNLFERAAWEEDEGQRQSLLTLAVVGGGPTGIETAGAIYELYNHVLAEEYPHGALHARVVLVEQATHLLAPYPTQLQRSALKQLESLGVDVLLGYKVVAIDRSGIVLSRQRASDAGGSMSSPTSITTALPMTQDDDGNERLATSTVIWAAGMKAAPMAEMLGVEPARGGRIPIDNTTKVRSQERVYAVGDIAYLEDKQGKAYPMLIPVAQQQGELAAENILADLAGRPATPFTYQDCGTMATIGRSRAVAWLFNRFALTGRLAWWAWLGLHLVMLLGFRNRLNVFINWAWNYLTYDRSVRVIWSQDSIVIDNERS